MHKAVFLDRDGVINEDTGHLHDVADLQIIPKVGQAIRDLNEKGYKVVVVANQSAVAKGLATIKDIDTINGEVKARLAREGAIIDAIYYCPHHPEGTVRKYATDCDCRKPGIGMIKTATADLGINLEESFLVGDKTSDILAGRRAGLKTVLVRTGYAGKDGQYKVMADFVADDLASAVIYIA